MIKRNGLYYYLIIKRMEYLDKVDKELDRKFIEIYNNLTELYKEKPF